MIVVDASVLAPALCDDGDDGDRARQRLSGETLAAPELIDLEVSSVLRRLVLGRRMPLRRADLAMSDLATLPLRRVSHCALLPRCWSLRENLTIYDASYVALAEEMGTLLVTADARLSGAPGLRCKVDVLARPQQLTHRRDSSRHPHAPASKLSGDEEPLAAERYGITPATDLEQRILATALRGPQRAAGQLPTERRLAEDLGVSRTSLRHALARLEAAGVLSREVGRGTFLRPALDGAASATPTSALSDVAPADVMTLRALIEPQAMGLVILHATERDIEEMDRCLVGGDTAESHADFEAWDRALHRSLIDATHSRLLQTLYQSVEAARDNQVWGQLKRRNDSAGRRSTYQCEHHRIVGAVKARDQDGATGAAREHLATVSFNIFGRVL